MKLEDLEDISTEYKKISASFLAKNNFFKGNYSGDLSWSNRKGIVECMRIVSYIFDNPEPYIELSYEFKETEENTQIINYKVFLIKVLSSIYPKRFFYYFKCPLSSKRTSILYKLSSTPMFLHRDNHPIFMNNIQLKNNLDNMEKRYGLSLENKYIKRKQKLINKMKNKPKKVPLKLIERVKDLEKQLDKYYIFDI